MSLNKRALADVMVIMTLFDCSKEQKNQLKKNQGKLGMGMGEQLLGFEDSEDEDYEAEATKRVNEAITSILIEEEGEMME